MFNKSKPDLVLLDIRLPKKDGFEVLKIIKEKDKNMNVIAQTAYAMPEERKRSLEAGFDEHLKKPLTSGELYQTIIRFLNLNH